MTYEHTLWTQKTLPISMTCADGTGIEKGTLLILNDADTVIQATGATGEAVAGIAYTEKIASNGDTEIAVLSGPGDEMKATVSGSVTAGDSLVSAGNNQVVSTAEFSATPAAATSGSVILGYSKETATDGQTIKYVLQIGAL